MILITLFSALIAAVAFAGLNIMLALLWIPMMVGHAAGLN